MLHYFFLLKWWVSVCSNFWFKRCADSIPYQCRWITHDCHSIWICKRESAATCWHTKWHSCFYLLVITTTTNKFLLFEKLKALLVAINWSLGDGSEVVLATLGKKQGANKRNWDNPKLRFLSSFISEVTCWSHCLLNVWCFHLSLGLLFVS